MTMSLALLQAISLQMRQTIAGMFGGGQVNSPHGICGFPIGAAIFDLDKVDLPNLLLHERDLLSFPEHYVKFNVA